jgi:phytoene dehydrogenase-like protein
MADKFTSLGGELILNTTVQKIAVENGHTVGVIIDGALRPADAVIVASDTMSAVDSLFNAPPTDDWVQRMKQQTQASVCTFACFGVHADLKGLPHQITFPLKKPVYCAGEPISSIGINNYAANTGYAPDGCTALTSILGETDTYDWWRKARENGSYAAEKQKLSDSLIESLGDFIPSIKNNLDVIDIATPLTYERYTASWHGSWMSKMSAGDKMVTYPCILKNMRGVFFAGQRAQPPGGLPVAVASGRRAVQLLCKETGDVFEGSMK